MTIARTARLVGLLGLTAGCATSDLGSGPPIGAPSDAPLVQPGFYEAYGVTEADELRERRDANGYYFARPSDGMEVAALFSGDVNYRGADGSFRPIDPTLRWADGDLVNDTHRFVTRMDGEDGAVEVSSEGLTVRWRPGARRFRGDLGVIAESAFEASDLEAEEIGRAHV